MNNDGNSSVINELNKVLSIDDLNKILNIFDININKENPSNIEVFEAISSSRFFSYEMFDVLFNENSDCLKQWFYISSLLRVESARYPGGFSYTMSTPDEFIFPILSDSEEVIKKFANLDTVHLLWGDYEPSYEEAKFKPSKDDPRYRTHAMQAVLRHDWEDYQRIKDIANQKINKLREERRRLG